MGIIGYLYINYLRDRVAGAVSVNPIRKNTITSNEQTELHNYYEPKQNLTETEGADWLPYVASYTINKDTLNDRYDYSVDKPDGFFRIITLGDSFTFGQFVDTQNNYSENLEDMLNTRLTCSNIKQFEVINLGMKGYDVHYAVERYRLRGEKYQPDLVMWLISDGNFLQDNEFMIEKLANLEPAEMLQENTFIIENPYYTNWERARLLLIEQVGKNSLLNKVRTSLAKFRSLYDGETIIYGFTYDAENKSVLRDFAQANTNIRYYESLDNIYEKDGVLPDKHPNAKGHRLIAEDLFRYLSQSNTIPCK